MADSAPVMVWMSGPDGRCTYFNAPWLDFTGRRLGEELGDGWATGVHLDDRQSVLESFRAALTAQREPGLLELSIRNTGIGVEDTELKRIFERFVTSKVNGLGMGLAISRSIVETHGGRIWATGNPDRGLTMRVELPAEGAGVRT